MRRRCAARASRARVTSFSRSSRSRRATSHSSGLTTGGVGVLIWTSLAAPYPPDVARSHRITAAPWPNAASTDSSGCSGSTRSSRPPTATSARRSTTRSASSPSFALGPHAGRLHHHRRDLLPDGRHLRRGDGDVPRGRRLLVVRPPRVQRVLVLLRRLGPDAQLRHHDRDLGVLRAALHRRAVLGARCATARATSSSASSSSSCWRRSTSSASRSRRGLNIALAVTDFATQLLLVLVGALPRVLARTR